MSTDPNSIDYLALGPFVDEVTMHVFLMEGVQNVGAGEKLLIRTDMGPDSERS